jgi:sortase A
VKLKIVVPTSPGRRAARVLLFMVAVACLGIYSYSYVYRTAYQLYEGWQFDHEAPAPVKEKKRVALPVVLPDPDHGTRAPKESIAASVIGRISIPRLHISAIVEEGIDDVTLLRAVGHIPGTALPGETGNIGIAGHRDTFFRALKDLQPHDDIDFTTHSGSFHYTVESLTVVEPDNVGVLKSEGGQALTIVTCFPFHYIGSAPRRFIVHAVSK